MTDLTKITTPFGLLDAETQGAMKAHGGPYEFWSGEGWNYTDYCNNDWAIAHRVKPTPPKPREWWLRLDARGNECGTDRVIGPPPPNWNPDLTIRVREVIE